MEPHFRYDVVGIDHYMHCMLIGSPGVGSNSNDFIKRLKTGKWSGPMSWPADRWAYAFDFSTNLAGRIRIYLANATSEPFARRHLIRENKHDCTIYMMDQTDATSCASLGGCYSELEDDDNDTPEKPSVLLLDNDDAPKSQKMKSKYIRFHLEHDIPLF
ncbi:unnamed protein product [Orchesella dallaii]|uniref:Uncharacterized protein n=1 Tax=Orchesella dallaii TaxID=48710 RepID=A0ABP1QCW2_9HEXA